MDLCRALLGLINTDLLSITLPGVWIQGISACSSLAKATFTLINLFLASCLQVITIKVKFRRARRGSVLLRKRQMSFQVKNKPWGIPYHQVPYVPNDLSRFYPASLWKCICNGLLICFFFLPSLNRRWVQLNLLPLLGCQGHHLLPNYAQ